MNSDLINKTIAFVKAQLKEAEGGHDWWHIYRVWQLARHIAETEKSSHLLTIELAALLHDVADSKFHHGNETLGPALAKSFLENQGCSNELIQEVVFIIENMSFKGGHNHPAYKSEAFCIVQDADRLDAMGALGIARAFNYGGFKNRPMYDPAVAPNLNMSREEYKKADAPTLNHFYEKLLLLKDRMNTPTGKAMAQQRHLFMEQFLEQFYAEWDGKR